MRRDETVALIRAEGGIALAVQADVTDQAAVTRMAAQVEAELGPIDLLVNNAGAGPPFGPTWEADTADWWRTVEVNLKGPMLCCHAVLPGMIARGRGRIVNVSSGGYFQHPLHVSLRHQQVRADPFDGDTG